MAALMRQSSKAGLLNPGVVVVVVLLLLLGLATPAFSLIINTTVSHCSRECESRHCRDPFKLRYGKYCGIGYTGCSGEEACDGIDSCCLSHDNCVGSNLENYVNRTCNEQLKDCVSQFKDAGLPQFNGSSCSASDVERVIGTSMGVATLGDSRSSPSPLTNLQWVTALVFILSVLLLFGW